MPRILIPNYVIASVINITAIPVAHGSIVVTHEIRCAMDTDRENSTYIWTGSDQPIKWRYGDLATTAVLQAKFGSDVQEAAYACVEAKAYDGIAHDPPNGLDYNTAQFEYSTDGIIWYNPTILGYGDGEQLDVLNWKLMGTVTRRGQFLVEFLAGFLYNYDWYKLNFDTENSNSGTNIEVFDAMQGLLVTLPEAAERRTWTDSWHGGKINETPLGKSLWSGLKSSGGFRGETVIFPEITLADRDILLEVFKAGRGQLPMIYFGDTSDTDTWFMCRIPMMKESEPVAGQPSVELTLVGF